MGVLLCQTCKLEQKRWQPFHGFLIYFPPDLDGWNSCICSPQQEVTNPLSKCTFSLSFSCFHQIEYSIFHCLEHSLKCWNLPNNLASWNYLVIDKSMEKWHLSNNHNIYEWKLPYCTNRSTVLKHRFISGLDQFPYDAVLQQLSYKSLARNQAAHYCVCLCPIVLTPHHSLCQHCTGLWALSDTEVFSTTSMHIPLCSYTFPIPTIWFVGGVLS